MSGKTFIDHFSALEDPRQSWKVVYPLPEILLIVLCATLATAKSSCLLGAAIIEPDASAAKNSHHFAKCRTEVVERQRTLLCGIHQPKG